MEPQKQVLKVNFSWDKDLQLVLYDKYDISDEIWFLAPNEQKVFLQETSNASPRKTAYIEITTEYDKKYDKTDKIEIFVPKSVFL